MAPRARENLSGRHVVEPKALSDVGKSTPFARRLPQDHPLARRQFPENGDQHLAVNYDGLGVGYGVKGIRSCRQGFAKAQPAPHQIEATIARNGEQPGTYIRRERLEV